MLYRVAQRESLIKKYLNSHRSYLGSHRLIRIQCLRTLGSYDPAACAVCEKQVNTRQVYFRRSALYLSQYLIFSHRLCNFGNHLNIFPRGSRGFGPECCRYMNQASGDTDNWAVLDPAFFPVLLVLREHQIL